MMKQWFGQHAWLQLKKPKRCSCKQRAWLRPTVITNSWETEFLPKTNKLDIDKGLKMGIQATHKRGAARTESAWANPPGENAVTTPLLTRSADEEQTLVDKKLSISICNTSFFSFCKIQEDDILYHHPTPLLQTCYQSCSSRRELKSFSAFRKQMTALLLM